jgi:hypothetical protein
VLSQGFAYEKQCCGGCGRTCLVEDADWPGQRVRAGRTSAIHTCRHPNNGVEATYATSVFVACTPNAVQCHTLRPNRSRLLPTCSSSKASQIRSFGHGIQTVFRIVVTPKEMRMYRVGRKLSCWCTSGHPTRNVCAIRSSQTGSAEGEGIPSVHF